MRAMTDGSQTISPPPRSISTSESPSRRWPLTDRLRPDEKNTNSACAGHAAKIITTKDTTDMEVRTVGREPFICCPSCHSCPLFPLRPLHLPRIDKCMEHPHPELSRIFAVGVEQCRNERFVDRNRQLRNVGRPEPGGRQRNFPKQLLLGAERES